MNCPVCNRLVMKRVKACRLKCLNCGYEIDCEDGTGFADD